jgi:hypothetical protein
VKEQTPSNESEEINDLLKIETSNSEDLEDSEDFLSKKFKKISKIEKKSRLSFNKKSKKKIMCTRTQSLQVDHVRNSLGTSKKYQIREEEISDTMIKNQNMQKMVLNQIKRSKSELKKQQQKIISSKLKLFKNISFMEKHKKPIPSTYDLIQKMESDEECEDNPGESQSVNLPSSKFKKLITMCSFQIDGQNSILRNTVLKDLVNKYSRKSVMKETSTFSRQVSSKKNLQTNALLTKIAELQKKNKILEEKNVTLEKTQRDYSTKITELTRWVNSLN